MGLYSGERFWYAKMSKNRCFSVNTNLQLGNRELAPGFRYIFFTFTSLATVIGEKIGFKFFDPQKEQGVHLNLLESHFPFCFQIKFFHDKLV
jgi:hypothetical protein